MKVAGVVADFLGAVSGIATNGPDEYPDWSYRSFEKEKAEIEAVWPKIRAKLGDDTETIALVEAKIAESFAAFAAGDKERGRDAMWAIYNSKIRD